MQSLDLPKPPADCDPKKETAPKHTTAMSASRRAYSTRPAPRSLRSLFATFRWGCIRLLLVSPRWNIGPFRASLDRPQGPLSLFGRSGRADGHGHQPCLVTVYDMPSR